LKQPREIIEATLGQFIEANLQAESCCERISKEIIEVLKKNDYKINKIPKIEYVDLSELDYDGG